MMSSFTNPETLVNPTPFFNQLRHERPVYFDEALNAYIVAAYKDVHSVLNQPNTFSSALALFHAYKFEEVVNGILLEKAHGPFAPILPMTDPPEHTRVRAALNLAFSKPRMMKFQKYIENSIEELFNGFLDSGRMEVMKELAVPLPVSVIAHLLDVPRERHSDIKRWTQAYTSCAGNRIRTEEEAVRIGNELADMQNFIAGHIENRRKKGQEYDDVLNDLVNSNGGGLSDAEILAIAAGFLVAGHETGSLIIVSILKTLAENPSMVEYLRNIAGEEKDKAYQTFIEEALRINAPVRMLPRVTTADAEVSGVAVPAGSLVFVVMASANMDEAVFGDNSEAFELDRKNASRHLTFGTGPHICIGNQLARMELKCLLKAIIDKMDDIKLADTQITLEDYSPVVLDINVHLNKLNITFKKTAA
jgi:cytochrome P450